MKTFLAYLFEEYKDRTTEPGDQPRDEDGKFAQGSAAEKYAQNRKFHNTGPVGERDYEDAGDKDSRDWDQIQKAVGYGGLLSWSQAETKENRDKWNAIIRSNGHNRKAAEKQLRFSQEKLIAHVKYYEH